MSVVRKARQALKVTVDMGVDRLADPRETLGYSYQRQVELLAKVRAEQPESGASERLEVTIEILRAQREAIKAAEVRSRVSDVWSSIVNEMDNAAISSQRRREMIAQLLTSVREMATASERLDQQLNALNQQQGVLETHARQALDAGREDLAREASARKAEIGRKLSDLASRRRDLQLEKEKFTSAYERLGDRSDD